MKILFIDNRESDPIKLLKEKINNDDIELKNLEIGDFIFQQNENSEIIIERKTIADFDASIKDGRYKDQKIRLKKYVEENSEKNIKIVYLLEGNNKTEFKQYWGAIINLMIRDSFYIIQSPNLEKSTDIIKNIYEKIKKKTFDIKKSNTIQTKKFKTSNFNTPQNCFISQLCQIPGVSEKIALRVSSHFKNFPDLIQKLSEENKNNLENKKFTYSIANIYLDPEKKNRKLGNKLAETIYKYIFIPSSESSEDNNSEIKCV